MTDPPPLMLTPRQAAERLGVSLPTLRRHALALEAVTGEELPRGEHLERLWPADRVQVLAEALSMVHRREAGSVAEALGALTLARTPQPVPMLGVGEELRALIREEVRAVLREELARLPVLPASTAGEGVREIVREELRAALDPDRLRVLTHALAPAPRRGLLARMWAAWRGEGR